MTVFTNFWVSFDNSTPAHQPLLTPSSIGNPISERIPTQPSVHTRGQGLNQAAGQTVGQAVKRTSEMTNIKDVSRPVAKRPKVGGGTVLSLSSINLAPLKVFSSRPTISSRGNVTFGFRHTCRLNCFFVPAYHPCTTWY